MKVSNILRAILAALALALASSAAGAQTLVLEYYHLDVVGSVRAVSNQSGALVRRHDFFPFGEEYLPHPLTGDVHRFAGKPRDAETALDYLGARSYAPRDGRLLKVDPVMDIDEALFEPQRWNRYSYSLNNPLIFVDPDGRQIRSIIERLTQMPIVQRVTNSTVVQRVTQRVVETPVVTKITRLVDNFNARMFELSLKWFSPSAGDAGAVGRGAARAIDTNKLHHIFDKPGRGLDDVVKALGSREAAFEKMENAAQAAFDAGKLVQIAKDAFQGTINVGGVDVTVKGNVVDGVFRIGSAWPR